MLHENNEKTKRKKYFQSRKSEQSFHDYNIEKNEFSSPLPPTGSHKNHQLIQESVIEPYPDRVDIDTTTVLQYNACI